MAASFDRPPRNPHTIEQLEVMRCAHLYRVERARYERIGTAPPTRPGMRPSLAVTCERCGCIRVLYPGERMQATETLILTGSAATAAGAIVLEDDAGQVLDESEAEPIDLPLPTRRRKGE